MAYFSSQPTLPLNQACIYWIAVHYLPPSAPPLACISVPQKQGLHPLHSQLCPCCLLQCLAHVKCSTNVSESLLPRLRKGSLYCGWKALSPLGHTPSQIQCNSRYARLPNNEQDSLYLTLNFLTFFSGLQTSRGKFYIQPLYCYSVIRIAFLTKCQKYPPIEYHTTPLLPAGHFNLHHPL